ncbi:MAG TPA: glycosyltransferase family 4 protein [Alphaproteobacteria bacterium]|nr:glycosyltransferase family 4 protein [Alphaproteobacteria bacterium]
MSPLWLAALTVVAVAASWGGTSFALSFLTRRAIIDRPNERSSHRVPTPRGGGIAVVPVALLAWVALGAASDATATHWLVLVAAASLAAVSWLDDVRGLPPAPRLLSHIASVALVLIALPGDRLVFQGALPLVLDRLLTGALWVWFINLYNFMDGIDGITGVETIGLGLGAAVIAALGGGMAAGVGIAPLGLTLAAAAAGFMVLNWHPARIFLGDVGSVPLGFLGGWLMIALAADGHWPTALILPAYYWADATRTLLSRAARLEPVWRAHREHAYQRAVAAGDTHDTVVLEIAGLNAALIALAALAFRFPITAIVLAAIATGWLLRRFGRRGDSAAPEADCA